MVVDIKELNERIQRESAFVDILTSEMDKVIIGQSNNATNVGIGIGGWGSASSFQGNSADVTNIIA